VLVPLCGKSLDLLWLRQQGYDVLGAELSSLALESFLAEHGIAAMRRNLDSLEVYSADRLHLFCGDFFKLNLAELGKFGAIYDRAALVSWPAESRPAYVNHLTGLTSRGTQTLLITMEYPQMQMHGPPFSISADEIDQLYGASHRIQLLGRHDILSTESRLRAKGITSLHQSCYQLTRV
jgi:thiopurine S-methyltransferase